MADPRMSIMRLFELPRDLTLWKGCWSHIPPTPGRRKSEKARPTLLALPETIFRREQAVCNQQPEITIFKELRAKVSVVTPTLSNEIENEERFLMYYNWCKIKSECTEKSSKIAKLRPQFKT